MLELKVLSRNINDDNELKDEYIYIIGLLKGVNRKVLFTGEMLGYRMNADENTYKKSRWYLRKNDFYLTLEYIDFRIVKKGDPRGPRPPPDNSRVLPPPERNRASTTSITTQTEKSISKRKEKLQRVDAETQIDIPRSPPWLPPRSPPKGPPSDSDSYFDAPPPPKSPPRLSTLRNKCKILILERFLLSN